MWFWSFGGLETILSCLDLWKTWKKFLFLLRNSFWVDQRKTYLLSQNDFRTLSNKLINSGLAFMAWYIGFVALFILLRVSFRLMVVLLNYDLACLFCCCSFVGDGFAFWFIPFIVDIFLLFFHSFFILCCCFFSSFFVISNCTSCAIYFAFLIFFVKQIIFLWIDHF